MSGLFYNLGRHLGRKVLPTIRKSQWIWDGLAGTEDEALRAEAALGSALAVELRAVTLPVNDPILATLVGELCRRLSASVRDQRRTFHGEVILDDFPNAMALPGGFLFLSLSLLELCDRCPDELAFVIGHEMGHVIRRHAWDRVLNDAALRVASAVTLRAGPWGGWMRQKGVRLLRSAFSQDSELEADELGARLAVSAGFAPDGALAWLQRIQRLERQSSKLGPYFASHPCTAERIARLEPLLRQLSQGRAASA